MNPDLQPFLQTLEEKWARLNPDASIDEVRELSEVIASEMRLPTPDDVHTESVHWVEAAPAPVRVRIFRHEQGGEQPCLVYLPGGYWMQGSPETHWDITSRIASWNRQTVICVDYAKAPENPFPAALNQCEAVVDWAFDNSRELGIDPSRISIGGDSAGANLAAAIALKLRDSERKLLSQLLVYPAVDFEMSRPSFTEHADAPLIKTADMPKVIAAYCPNEKDLLNPMAAPLRATSHAELPPTYLGVAECDPLRDDGIAYAEALQAAGVPVELDAGTGLIHGYLRAMEFCSDCTNKLKAMASWLDDQNRSAANAT